MLRILHISPDFNYACGVSRHVYLLLRELKRCKKVQIFFITNKGDSLERITDLDIHPYFINFKRGNKNPIKLFVNVLSLYKFCKLNDIHVIHTHHRYPELVSYFVSKLLPIKTITTVHSIVSGFEHFSFKSDHIIAVSNFVKQNLQEVFDLTPNKISVLNNFVNPSTSVNNEVVFNLVSNYNILQEDKVLLFCGRITKMKGCNTLITVFNELMEVKKNIKLILVGSFELSADYKNIVKNNSNIILINPQKNIDAFYQIAAIVISPSHIDSFPYTMLEAGLARKAFIGGRIGGIAEFIDDGENGLLVEPGNKNELKKSILNVLEDYNLRQRLGHNLYEKVLRLTSAEKYITKLLEIYER